jgi:hypothetical protein
MRKSLILLLLWPTLAWARPRLDALEPRWSGSLKAGGELGLTLRVNNRSREISRGVICNVFFQGKKIGQLQSPSDLAPGAEVRLEGRISLPSQIPDSVLEQSPEQACQLQLMALKVADLSPTDIALEPTPEGLRWTVTVVNQGQAPAPSLPYRLSWDGQMVAEKKMLQAVAPGDAAQIVFQDKRPGVTGKHKLSVQVDPQGEVEDANVANNNYQLEWQAPNQRPDLSIRSWSVEPTVLKLGEPLRILFGVTNSSEIEMFKVPVALKVDGKVVAEKKFFQSIPAQSETEIQWSWLPTDLGQHQLQLVCLGQTSPGRTITVEGRPGYALQLVSANLPRRSPQGKDWVIDVVVQNQGSEASEMVKAVLWADGSRVWSARTQGALAPGQQATLSLRWSAERAGSHQLKLQLQGQGTRANEKADVEQIYPVEVETNP